MANALRFNDFNVRNAARHPALHGLKKLARGAFCAVYDKGDTVLKLTCDEIQYWFSNDIYTPEGPFFPKLIKTYGAIGETADGLPIYLMEMEKLAPIGRSAPIDVKRLRRMLLAQTEHHISGGFTPCEMKRNSYDGLGKVIEEGVLAPGLIDALEQVRSWMGNYEAVADFHGKNLMMRGSQLVLNDGVADAKSCINILRSDW